MVVARPATCARRASTCSPARLRLSRRSRSAVTSRPLSARTATRAWSAAICCCASPTSVWNCRSTASCSTTRPRGRLVLGDLGAQLGKAIRDERGRGLLFGQQAAHVGQLGRDGARGGAELRHLVGDRLVARDDRAERDDLTRRQLMTRDRFAQRGDVRSTGLLARDGVAQRGEVGCGVLVASDGLAQRVEVGRRGFAASDGLAQRVELGGVNAVPAARRNARVPRAARQYRWRRSRGARRPRSRRPRDVRRPRAARRLRRPPRAGR